MLHARIGEYGVVDRRKGEEWFVGGINGTQSRELTIRFDFLDPGRKYSVKIYSDDPAVDSRTNVRIDTLEVSSHLQYESGIGANQGFAMHIIPVKL